MPGLTTVVDTLTKPDQAVPDMTDASRRRRTWALLVACAGVALVIGSMIALNAALGDIAVATSATQTQLTWVVDGYTLALACLLLPAGAIGDRYGRRNALLIGLVIFTLASVAPIWFDGPVDLIVWRAVAGAGAAFMMPAMLSMLTVVYPKDQRTKAVASGPVSPGPPRWWGCSSPVHCCKSESGSRSSGCSPPRGSCCSR